MSTLLRVVSKLNVAAHISYHLLGKHSNLHRRWTGFAIMIVGVGLVKATTLIDMHVIHFFGDVIGYGLHGIGLIPFAHSIEQEQDQNLN